MFKKSWSAKCTTLLAGFLVLTAYPLLITLPQNVATTLLADSPNLFTQSQSSLQENNYWEPAWSPDGERIAFVTDKDGNHEIYIMNADGTALQNITNYPSWDSEPAWSPDGEHIVFASDRNGNHEIYTMNADGTNVQRLTYTLLYDSDPAWSPDEETIIFVSFGEWADIFMMNSNGTNPQNVTDNLLYESDPCWSPDSSHIAFALSGEAPGDIYVMDVEEKSQQNITTTPAADEACPGWSPDNSHIVFASKDISQGNWDIYVTDADGSARNQLTFNAADDFDPMWSPDGKKIIFVSDRTGPSTLYLMNSDGTNVTSIMSNVSQECCSLPLSVLVIPIIVLAVLIALLWKTATDSE